MKQFYALFVSQLLLSTFVFAQKPFSINVEPKEIVKQVPTEYSGLTCAPASILNCLHFGSSSFRSVYDRLPGKLASEKLSFVISRYGSGDSVVMPGYKMYTANYGMYDEDILAMFNALLADYNTSQVNGIFAGRLGVETSFAYLRRIHKYLAQSLSNEVPVVAGLEAYAANEHKDSVGLRWMGLHGHTIVITSAPRALTSSQQGFTFEFVDSSKGAMGEGYIYTEDIREFQVIHRSGSHVQAVGGSPSLLVVIPLLGLGRERQAWNVRTIIVLDYLIGQFPK